MKRAVWLLTLGVATSVIAQVPRTFDRCDDDEASCRETCTLEFGTSLETRGRLAACLASCASHRRTCGVMAADEDRKKTPRPPPRAPARPVEPPQLPKTEDEAPKETSKKGQARTQKRPVNDVPEPPPDAPDDSAWGKER